ncbi:MAG: phage/plasmid primase, P4 family [Thermoproteota archaeon]|nr:phage/plasmid primase, P4 family [Thermoproteota archaeon]
MTVEATDNKGIKISNLYSKRTVAAKTTPIPVPPQFKLDEKVEYPGGYHDSSLHLFYVTAMCVEGNDGVNSKLVIKHYPTKTDAYEMVVPLRGYWNEFERPDLEKQFDNNFLLAVQYTEEQEKKLLESKEALIAYLYDYFHNDPIGRDIMSAVRKKAEIQQQKLERQEAPKSDKIIRETAEHILSRHHIATIVETDEMLYYDKGVYVPGAEAIIEEECEFKFDYDMSNHLVEEIKGHIRRRTHRKREEFDSDLYVVNYKNCLYDIRHDEVREHKPEYLSLDQKPMNYDPNIKPKLFGPFLGQVLYPTQIRTMVELFAYTFYRANPHEIFVNQFGYGSNGKTVMMSVLKALHGPKNSSNIPLKHLINDRFAPADLEGKDVNVDDEATAGTLIDITKLKKLTGNQPTWVQRKIQQPYEAVLHAKYFFTSNELPDFTDTSEGRYRREIVIAYPNKFVRYPNLNNPEERKEDPYLEKKLTTEEELTGIASMCMKVLRRILFAQDMRVHVDLRSIEERKKHRELLKNPMAVFVEQVIDSYSATSEDIVFKDDLYKIYKRFCQLNKVPPLGKDSAFSQELKKLLDYPNRLRDGREGKPAPGQTKRRKFWNGIVIKMEWNDPDGQGVQKSLLTQEDEDEDTCIIPIEENTEGHVRHAKTAKTSCNQLENNDLNPISSDISRSESGNIGENRTKICNQFEAKNQISVTERDARDVHNYVIEELIDKAMGDKGYCTEQDFVFITQIAPNLGWSEADGEQTFRQLIQEGKLEELESGKYKPVDRLGEGASTA